MVSDMLKIYSNLKLVFWMVGLSCLTYILAKYVMYDFISSNFNQKQIAFIVVFFLTLNIYTYICCFFNLLYYTRTTKILSSVKFDLYLILSCSLFYALTSFIWSENNEQFFSIFFYVLAAFICVFKYMKIRKTMLL